MSTLCVGIRQRQKLREGGVAVLDVRPPGEYAAWDIPGARNVHTDVGIGQRSIQRKRLVDGVAPLGSQFLARSLAQRSVSLVGRIGGRWTAWKRRSAEAGWGKMLVAGVLLQIAPVHGARPAIDLGGECG